MAPFLGLLIGVWEPLRFAGEAAGVLPTIAYRGWLAAVELGAHALVAAASVAGGVALWNGVPDGRRMAAIAVALSVARTVQSLYWTALPGSTRPGDEPYLAGLAILAGVALIATIRRA